MHSRNILTFVALVFVLFFSAHQLHAVPLLGDKQQRQAKKLWKQGRYMEAIRVMRKRCRGKKEIKKMANSVEDLAKFIRKTPDSAVKEMQSLCNKGDADGCADMGWYLFSKNNGFCVQYFRRACEYGDSFSCFMLGTLYYGLVDLLHRNCKKAEHFLKKACEKGELHACYNLGILYKYGCDEVKKDKKLSKKYFTKACDFGSKDACKELRPKWRKVLGF